MKLQDRVALITGASSGIGRATAVAFANEGARLVLVGRDREELEATATAAGVDAVIVAEDLARAGAAERCIAAAVGACDGLDILVNAAGIIGSGTVESTTDEEWAAMMQINVDAVFRLMRAATPYLKPRRGAIVNVSSVTGLRAFPGVLAYCVSKAAVDQLTRCVALELAADGVRVNAVNPGVVVTELHRRSGMDSDTYSGFLEHGKTTHPLGRVGQPDEIAAAILFLASEASEWITGETISVDGGRHLTCAR
jgi:NAD(P)-dependent dehydrogenase (short-subunit alcohol dehydrogenase family)